jgi:Putative esterase
VKNLNRFILTIVFIFIAFVILKIDAQTVDNGLRFDVAFSDSLSREAQEGRALLIISTDSTNEPRFQINETPKTQLIFGIQVDSLKPGEWAVFNSNVFGYPLESLSDVPPGMYYIQVLLNRYQTYHLANGKTVELPPDKGEGQQWNIKPGNFYSTVQKIYLNPRANEILKIVMNKKIPPIKPEKDTKYLKHIRIKSDLLSKFWGIPVYFGAKVLLPYGFDDHPSAHYPLMVFHGHFSNEFFGWRETPPDTSVPGLYSTRFHVDDYNYTMEKYAYEFYKEWTGPNFPRFIIIEIQQANPYYDDSYAVNSANMGPYGDAINYELIPYIEKKFRGLGKPWARFLYGGSTGGWEALATQIFYPNMYNGCFAACPDPIDFRKFQLINIYNDDNAYYTNGVWQKIALPESRDYLGNILSTDVAANHLELVIGTKGRSGGQWDAWQAVFSPQGKDGYPEPIWNKMAGKINHSVAEYWKEHYDLRYILQRDWKILGPKLKGKIHIYVGEMDTYYLNDAVYLMENFLRKTTDPYYDGEVDYGYRAEHCWNGDHNRQNAISRLRYNQMYVPKIMDRIMKTAPPGADVTSWRY